MSSILKSADLIRSIKRRAFIPESQETFKPEDFLEIATEKTNIALMSTIMDARGDYLVYYKDFKLVEDVLKYELPARAHGDKLREASIVNSQGKTIRELTQISMEELVDYQADYVTFSRLNPFYLENNTLILLNRNYQPDTYIRMYFYMRPNKLVVENRAATVTQVSSSVEVDTVSPKSGTITGITTSGIITCVDHGLSTGDKIIVTGTDTDPAIDGVHTVTYLSKDTIQVPLTAPLNTAGTVGSWQLAADVVVLPSVNFPKHFTADVLYDIVQSTSPNKIKLYDVPANSINNAQKTLSFRVKDVSFEGTIKVTKGDYITKSEETIVPNIPTEFHPLLAQMVAVSCMEGMADEQQKKSAESTLKKMEEDILNIVTNRVEGAPKKIKNRHGPLVQAIRTRRILRR